MKQEGNKRILSYRGGSYFVIIPPALALDKGFQDGDVVEWRTTTDGLLLRRTGERVAKEARRRKAKKEELNAV